MQRRALLSTLTSLALLCGAAATRALESPAQAAASLLEADRSFAQAAADGFLPDSLAPMFADDVVMPAPPGDLVRGRTQVLAAIKANPANIGARLTWSPLRVSVSADGRHGYSYGYMTLTPPKGDPVPQKYLAYWERQADGWKVSAYKRTRRPAGAVPGSPLPPLLPAGAITGEGASDQAGLAAREQAFSDRAQQVGLDQAFREFGHPEAINLGGAGNIEVVMGNAEIGRLVGEGTPKDASPVSWSAEWARLAPGGDLGITFGFIRHNQPGADGKTPPPIPFFTIWRRADRDAPWLYVAE